MTRTGNATNIAIAFILIALTPRDPDKMIAEDLELSCSCTALPPVGLNWPPENGRQTHYRSWQNLGSPSPPNVASDTKRRYRALHRACRADRRPAFKSPLLQGRRTFLQAAHHAAAVIAARGRQT